MKASHKSNLAELQAFVAIADARSFTRAANALGVSPSALSHTIRALETRVGVSLLARTTRSVAPTQAGERLLATLRPAFADIATGLRAVGDLRDKPSGTVRITTFKHAAQSVLVPVLARFHAAHPDVRIEIITEDRFVDIVAEGYDAGLRWADQVDKDMVAVTVGKPTQLAIVGSPAYFEEHPIPRTPRDLVKHRCINYRLVGSGRLHQWELESDGRVQYVKVDGPLVVNDGELGLRAAIDGLGLACYYASEVEPHIAAGRLVRVLRRWTPPYPPYQIFYPSRRAVTPALAALVAMLRR